MSFRKCCVPGCDKGLDNGATLHGFPNPNKDKKLFNTWVYNVSGDLLQLENDYIVKYRRVCRGHFEEKYWCRNNRLTKDAVPMLHMPDSCEAQGVTDKKKHLRCFAVIEGEQPI